MKGIASFAFGVLAILWVELPGAAQSLPTKAHGLGSSNGNGVVRVNVSIDDPTERVRKAWLIVESDCPFSSKSKRKISLGISSLSDLDNGRECKILRSWLCMQFRSKALRKGTLVADGKPLAVEFIAGYKFIVGNSLLFPVKSSKGNLPNPGESVEARWLGDAAQGFEFKGVTWSVKIPARQMCLSDGTSEFFGKHDPSLDGTPQK